MKLVTLDFETYYSKEFSLSRMTTEEYIRDPRFQVIGLGVKIDNGPSEWIDGTQEFQIHARLRALQLEGCALLCHNAAFDGAILAWHYGIIPKFYIDTLSMARPIHNLTVGGSLKKLAEHYQIGAKGTEVVDAMGKRLEDFSAVDLAQYGRYCMNDVDLTFDLFHKLNSEFPDGRFPADEMRAIDLMIRLYTQPAFVLDKELLAEHLENVKASKDDLLGSVIEAARAQLMEEDETSGLSAFIKHLVEARLEGKTLKDLVMSNPKMAELLRLAGVEPPTKVSPRTGKEAFAFAKSDKAFKALLDHENPLVANLVAARLGVKSTIEETRTVRFIGLADRGSLPIMLNYYGAHTGRASGGEKLNLQNLPRGGTLRKSLRAPEGHSVIACDSAQIEARVLAYVSGQEDLVDSFRRNGDVYSEFAEKVYGYPVSKATPKERQVGKVCILGLGYGMGAAKFPETLRIMGGVTIEPEEGERIVKLYREINSSITAYWRRAGQALAALERGEETTLEGPVPLRFADGKVYLPNGLWVAYPNLNKTEDGYEYEVRRGRSVEKKYIYSGKVVENIVQALARIVVFDQMLEIHKHLKKLQEVDPNNIYRVVSTVHDEVVVIAPTAVAEKVKALMEKVMSQAPAWAPELPIACEAELGDSYGECK